MQHDRLEKWSDMWEVDLSSGMKQGQSWTDKEDGSGKKHWFEAWKGDEVVERRAI